MIWRYSWQDSIPCSITLFQFGLNFWLAATWTSRTFEQNLLFIPLCLFLFWYNGLVASHNFVHTPWFQSDFLNRCYAVLNSVNIGLPQSHYHQEHLKHHRYGNDRPQEDGTTKDPTSTFACGKDGDHEPVASYCFLGLFRTDLLESFQEIVKRGGGKQLMFEVGACLLGLLIYLSLSWQYFLFLFLPTFYLGWVLEHLENYYEHFGGTPENKYLNSTSYYGKLYNFLFCNEGYHQEHHLRPNVHWQERPNILKELRDKLDTPDRVVLQFPPTLAWLEHRRIEYQYVNRWQVHVN